MNKIKILIAEDIKEARDLIADGIREYAIKKFNDGDYFSIDKADSYFKGLQLINECEKKNEFYNIFFVDIDFSEDNKGGLRDSGYSLIEKAFEVCPITTICTYSGQFHARDLWDKHEELKEKGLIVQTMDKSHGEGGEQKWIEENLDKIVAKVNDTKYLWDIWENHNAIIDDLKEIKLDDDLFEDVAKKNSIVANFDSILVLLKNKDKFNELPLIYRLITYLYHNSLEIFCKGVKSDSDIIQDSNSNKSAVENIIGRELKFNAQPNAIRIIVSYTADKRSKFGFKLNDYRNKSIHPNEKFKVEFSNILFANLTLALYVLDKKEDINVSRIKSLSEDGEFIKSNRNGIKDLSQILGFVKS